MGTPDNKTEVMRVVLCLFLLLLFVFGLDPLIITAALNALGLSVGLLGVYACIGALVSLAVTVGLVLYLFSPTTPTIQGRLRKIDRIT